MCPTLVTVLEFLHELRKRNLGYSVLNKARGMLSSFATIEGYDAGKHPFVCRYMKGVYNSYPSLPKGSLNLGYKCSSQIFKFYNSKIFT